MLFAADQDLDADWLRVRRGWSEPEWAAAAERLAARGLLGRRRALTDGGRALRAEVEARTDELADAPWAAVGDARAERLVALAAPLVAAIVAGGGFLAGTRWGCARWPRPAGGRSCRRPRPLIRPRRRAPSAAPPVPRARMLGVSRPNSRPAAPRPRCRPPWPARSTWLR